MAFILVFSNKNGYSIILASPDKNRTAKCLLNLVKPLIINKYKTDASKRVIFNTVYYEKLSLSFYYRRVL